MLERVLEQQQALYAVLMENKEKYVRALLPDAGEWGIIEDLISILKPFTDTLSMQQFCCLLQYYTSLFISRYLKEDDKDSTIVKSVKHAICTDIKSRYVSGLLNVAAFLDSRFKQLDPFVAETDHEDVVKDVISEILFTCEEYLNDKIVELPSRLDDDEDDEQTGPATKKRKEGVLSRLLGNVITTKTNKKPTNLEIIRSEIQCYFHDAIVGLNDDH